MESQDLRFTQLGPQSLLALCHHGGGNGVTQHIGRRTAHVEEVVDPQQQQDARLRNVELENVAAMTTSEARGTPAIPLEVTISSSNMVIC